MYRHHPLEKEGVVVLEVPPHALEFQASHKMGPVTKK